jgi:hypothetical protein
LEREKKQAEEAAKKSTGIALLSVNQRHNDDNINRCLRNRGRKAKINRKDGTNARGA